MAKLALIFTLFFIGCSFLSLAAEPVKYKCPETPLPASRYRICTMDMRTYCLVHRDGTLHQYRGSGSCVCSDPKIASYFDGWCSEGHKQEHNKKALLAQQKLQQEIQETIRRQTTPSK